jgi:hypothetical protein
MDDGICDPYNDETDVDTSTSTNELYDASDDSYTGVGADTEEFNSLNTTFSSYGAGGMTIVDRDWAINNSTVIAKVAIYSNSAQSFQPKIMLENTATDIDVTYDTDTFSHGGSGWQTFTYTTPTTIPASGVYRYGCYSTYAMTGVDSYNSAARAYATGSSNNSTTFTSNTSGGVFPVKAIYQGSAANMTLVSNAFTADAVPATGRIYFHARENVSSTINTDLTAEISRDGGTNFTTVTLALVQTLADGTKAYEGTATISGQPSGTAMKYRIKTLNTKDIDVLGTVLQWST